MANGMISTFPLQVSLLDALRDHKPAGGNRLEHTAYVLRRGLGNTDYRACDGLSTSITPKVISSSFDLSTQLNSAQGKKSHAAPFKPVNM